MKRKMSSHHRNNNTNDLISELPSNIIEKILELMPVQDATRTSILSTNWRYKWTSLPQLVFDKEFFNHPKRKQHIHVVNIINQILLLRDGLICKFSLCVPLFFDKNSLDLGRWMRFLSVDGVREIFLEDTFPFGNKNPITLPSTFFSCQELTYLDLRNFIFEPPRVFRGFKHLTTLYFRSVVIPSAVFETLVSAAHRLERLTCIDCPGFDHVNFHATNLKFMQLCGEFKSISINQSPYLSEVSIELSKQGNYFIRGRSGSLVKIIDHWPRLKKLVIGCYALSLKVFAAVNLQKSFPYLENLHLNHTYFQDVDQFSSAFCLIRSSPNLHKLEISNPSFDSAASQEIVNFINEKDYIECSLGRLRTVRMAIVNGSSLELELLKYFLSSTPVLETIIVEISRIDPQAEVSLTRKLMQFRRVSPKAEVIYKNK